MGRPRLILAILALAGALALSTAPIAAAALSAETMYEPTTVAAIDLQLPPASVAALEAEPDDYVEGTFALAESTGTPGSVGPYSAPLTVGIRLKGAAGFRGLDRKAAFKIKFNEFVKGQKFLGLKKMTLNNMVQDPSMIHEVLAYDAFRAAGVPAPHTGYAYLYVNGVDYGLHLNLEPLDDVALEKRFGALEDQQHLYEGAAGNDVGPAAIGDFEVDEGDEDDRADLDALNTAVAAPSPGFTARMAPVADLGEMTAMWAVERYIGHWDGYSSTRNNYYLYSDPDGVFQMLPWGTDQDWDHWWFPFDGGQGLLFQECLADEACAALYRAALVDVEHSTTALDLDVLADQLATLLAPWQAMEIEDSERAPFNAGQIAQAVAAVHQFLELRPGALAKWLDSGENPQAPEEPAQEPATTPATARTGTTVPAASPLSKRLEVDRSMLARGLLITRIEAKAPGSIAQVGEIATADGSHHACATEQAVTGGGTPTLRCRLSGRVRRHLAVRWLRLRLQTSFFPHGGAAATVTRTVLLPRQAG